MVLITRGATTITPTAVERYEADRESGNIVHPIINRENPDVTQRPAQLRTGTLEITFTGSTAAVDSKAAVDAHATPGVFTLFHDVPTVGMFYLPAGRISRSLDDASKQAWRVSVEYQEVIV
jgi:hypothetical protein